jgi:alanine racemase
LDDVPDAQIGDEVVLIGRQGDACIRAEEVAKTWGTINYEVICGLANRVPRLYKE